MTIKCILNITRGAHMRFQTILIYGCIYSNGCDINTLRMNSFYVIFCRQTKLVLRVSLCSTSTASTPRHRIIPMLSADVGNKSGSGQRLVWTRRSHSRGPLYATGQADC
jgi:hypothetical protein